VEVIGWLYQYYIAERKAEVFAGFKKGKKAGADEIPAATQLFTPDWIVRYLVQNSAGRLWMLNHPDSRLIDQMEYYIAPVGDPGHFLKIDQPEDLTAMDPACGSGHMLTYAFDLLYAIYEEEGYAPADIPRLILTHNLFGCEIDPRAGALAAFALTMKARAKQRSFFRNPVQPNICVIQPVAFDSSELDQLIAKSGDRAAESAFWNAFAQADTLGSLVQVDDAVLPAASAAVAALGPETLGNLVARASTVVEQARYLGHRYTVVVTNPPYMGAKNMNADLAGFLKNEYGDSKSDLFSAFFDRCFAQTMMGGQLGFMSPYVWMFIKTYEPLRKRLLTAETITSLVQLEYSGFADATVPICAFTVQRGANPAYEAGYVRLSDFVGPSVQALRALEAIQDQTKSWFCRASAQSFNQIPGRPIVYWLSDALRGAFKKGKLLGDLVPVKHGMSTGNNSAVVRDWWEVSRSQFEDGLASAETALQSKKTWFPYNKGGKFRRWYGNAQHALRYDQTGQEYLRTLGGHRHDGREYYFAEGVTWTFVSSGAFAARYVPVGYVFDVAGSSLFPAEPLNVLGFLCSSAALSLMDALNPTINSQVGDLKRLPILSATGDHIVAIVKRAVATSRMDWDDFETSWDFRGNPLVVQHEGGPLYEAVAANQHMWGELVARQQRLEEANNQAVAELYGLADEVPSEVPLERVSLTRNPAFRWPKQTEADRAASSTGEYVHELVSYAVGCMFGRYSLDEPGLILASQGETLKDYLAKAPEPSFMPDADGVIPVTGGEWFEDDIVGRFRKFLRVAFGDEHFAENLRYIEATLGKSLRQYFLKDFYKEHCSRYSNRPIYWMFSSQTAPGKGAFNALIYLHRYTPATLNAVLNEYLREFQAKLRAEIATLERSGSSAELKQADAHRKALVECEDYERYVLYPLASRNPAMDLDDGVLVNYLRFGQALVTVAAIENKRKDVEGWTWPNNPLTPRGA
jgi:hypothetical protein